MTREASTMLRELKYTTIAPCGTQYYIQHSYSSRKLLLLLLRGSCRNRATLVGCFGRLAYKHDDRENSRVGL